MDDVRLVFFDLETTGLDTSVDRIVELAMYTDGAELVTLINPGVPIPAQAMEVHHITDADVAGAPTFAELAERVEGMVTGAVLVGFNSLRFDVPLLDAELRRVGRKGLDRTDWGAITVNDIDLYRVWTKMETRHLTDAARRFAGVELGTDAHRAGKDAGVLRAVMAGMARAFFTHAEDGTPEQLRCADIMALQAATAEPELVDRDGRFKRREDGKLVFAFGKHIDEPLAKNPDYLKWMLTGTFAEETKDITRRLLARLGSARGE